MDGCCEDCGGKGSGGPASDESTNGKCWTCKGTGHQHNPEEACPWMA